jgi:hypothetical protein
MLRARAKKVGPLPYNPLPVRERGNKFFGMRLL